MNNPQPDGGHAFLKCTHENFVAFLDAMTSLKLGVLAGDLFRWKSTQLYYALSCSHKLESHSWPSFLGPFIPLYDSE